MHRLAARAIPSLPPGKHADGGGLVLEVTAAGTRSWTVRFVFHGREAYAGLGGFPAVSLARAREMAAEARAAAKAGRDPRAARRAARMPAPEQRTVRDAIADHIEAHRGAWRPATIKANESLLGMLDGPDGIAALPLEGLSTEHIVTRLRDAWMRTPQRARKAADLLRLSLDRAMALGWMPDGVNPAATNRLRRTLPRPTMVRAVAPMASLPWAEVPAFWTALREREGAGADALRLAILTGCRHSEVVGARWEEIDRAAGVWMIPAARTKQKKPQPVPLTGPMLEVLDRRASVRRAGSPFIFVGNDARRPLSSNTLVAVIDRMGEPWAGRVVPHGFRSSLRSYCADHGVAAEVAEALLGHVADQVVAAYQRGLMLDRRRAVLADWARFVTEGPAAE